MLNIGPWENLSYIQFYPKIGSLTFDLWCTWHDFYIYIYTIAFSSFFRLIWSWDKTKRRERARDQNPPAFFPLPSSQEKLAEGSIFFPQRHDDDKSPLMNDKRRRDFCNFIQQCVGQEQSLTEAGKRVAYRTKRKYSGIYCKRLLFQQ